MRNGDSARKVDGLAAALATEDAWEAVWRGERGQLLGARGLEPDEVVDPFTNVVGEPVYGLTTFAFCERARPRCEPMPM